jgi:hypothetical protein
MINITDGTKIRMTEDEEFSADFPESIDMKITDRCEIGCPMCHEGSTKNGKHANLCAAFLDTLRPFTEVAIGGGSVSSHPQIDDFLRDLKKKKILANITVHEKELLSNYERIQRWIDEGLVKGIGVSICSIMNEKVFKFASHNKNTVLHIIAGLTPMEMIESYGGMDLKLLILGYKNWGRGAEYYRNDQKHIEETMREAEERIDHVFAMFKVVSFDNLALRQLNIKGHVDDDVWNAFYQGSDATHTMYVDLVKREFAATSTSEKRCALTETIDEMFARVKGTMNNMM